MAISSGGAAELCAWWRWRHGAIMCNEFIARPCGCENLRPMRCWSLLARCAHRCAIYANGPPAAAMLALACAMMRSSRYHICKIHSPCAGLRANSESEANAPLELSCAMMRSSLYNIVKIRSPCAAGAHHRASAVCSHTFACFAVLPLLRPLKSYVLQ